MFGIVSDKFGRKPVVFISSVLACLGCLISGFVGSLWLFVLCRFVSGVGIGKIYIVFYDIKQNYS